MNVVDAIAATEVSLRKELEDTQKRLAEAVKTAARWEARVKELESRIQQVRGILR